MTIDFAVFQKGFDLLCEQHFRQATPALASAYKRILEKHLDDAQYQLSIEKSIASDREWPTPHQLIEHVLMRVTSEARAITAWQRVMSTPPSDSYSLFFFDAGEKALKYVGGYHALMSCDIQGELPARRKEFLSAYLALDDMEEFFVSKEEFYVKLQARA